MAETLFMEAARWLEKDGPQPEVVVSSHCRLARNLADFPFPLRFSHDESARVVDRVQGALQSSGLLRSGHYYSFTELGASEARVLVERQLIPREMLRGTHERGVYISNDQSLSIVVNGTDHLCIHAMASGLQLEEVWARVSLLDDRLSERLEYAYHERLGFLTSSLNQVGTGLKASVILHLPALLSSNAELARELAGMPPQVLLHSQRYVAEELFGKQSDFIRLTNWSSLGQPEAEIVFHLNQTASHLAHDERDYRAAVRAEDLRHLEDRVSRAIGIARNARLLEFREAVSVLSALRLGAATGMLRDSVHKIDALLVASQNAHLLLKAGRDCDDLTLSGERADLFRANFS